MVIRTDNKWALQAGVRKNQFQMHVNVFELTDLHEVDPSFSDIVLNTLLELLSIPDTFNGISFFTGMNRHHASEFSRFSCSVFNWDVNPVIPAFSLNRCGG